MSVFGWVAVGVWAFFTLGLFGLVLFVKPTQETYDKYGPSYMMSAKARRRG